MPVVNNTTNHGAEPYEQNRKLCLAETTNEVKKADTKTVSARVSKKLKLQLETEIIRIGLNKNDAITEAIILFLGLDKFERNRRLNGYALSILIAIRSDINRIGNLFALEVKKAGSIDKNAYDELKKALLKIQEIALHLNELRSRDVL